MALALAIASATSALLVGLLSSRTTVANRLASAGDVLSGGTLLLALVAALVALQAFAVTTGLPDLKVQVWFDSSDRNRPVFLASTLANGWLQTDHPAGQTVAKIRLRNQSAYAAQNATMLVRLHGIASVRETFRDSAEWWGADAIDDIGITSVQWDGGSTFLIHGHSMRRLPDLNLGRLLCIGEWGDACFVIDILASPGYRRTVAIPVEFVIDGAPRALRAEGEKSRDWL